MATFELKMPKLGESITEATITKWLKNVGDRIELDEAVVELATDKVDSEIPSPVEGILKEQHYKEGDTVEVETVIAIIETDAEGQEAGDETGDEKEAPEEKEALKEAGEEKEAPDKSDEEQEKSDRFYSPLVRSIAKEEKLSMKELDVVTGTGKDDRVTKGDLLNYLKNRDKPQPKSTEENQPREKHQPVKVAVGTSDEVVEMDRMRKLIADHMVQSRDTSVHITLFKEVDMSSIVRWRESQKKVLKEREGENLTFTPIFIEAIAKAIKDYPMINVSLDGHKIIKHKDINVGMAAALPDGNLIVPVIRQANHKNLLGLAKEVNDLAKRARNNQLKPDDIQGGTFTLTNFGTFGASMGTPIINQPQVAILGVGLIEKKPVVVESAEGDSIGIRHRMMLSLACDHRIVDGALGGMFLQRVAEYLEAFDVDQKI